MVPTELLVVVGHPVEPHFLVFLPKKTPTESFSFTHPRSWTPGFSSTEFALLQTDSPDFAPVDRSVSAPPGYRQPSEAVASVCFEPHQLGQVKGLLTLSSEMGGSYTFVLRGTCIPPQAQGPFNIKPGRSLNIPFKNVFLQSTTFSFQVNEAAEVLGISSMVSLFMAVLRLASIPCCQRR